MEIRVFDEKFREIIAKSIRGVLLENNDNEEIDEKTKADWKPEKPNSLCCSYCRVEFEEITEQRDHYKHDWHRYNLRQSLLRKQPITEEDFYDKTSKDDISSISGSDSESSKDETLDTYPTAQGKFFLQNNDGKVFSIYASLLSDKKEELTNDAFTTRLRQSCIANEKWAVFMLGGGHFAGAIFARDVPLLHKTFHCYTVRAGQGGAQSSRDNKSGGSHPKSAGASLRRYNEQALVQHVKGITESWRSELNGCGLIFYRAAGPYNRAVLFGGAAPLLDKGDKRVRSIPFSTRRATFAEVKRVHSVLTTVHVYDSIESAVENFTRYKEIKQKRSLIKSPSINRAKSREVAERPLLVEQKSETSSDEEVGDFFTENLTISFEETLQELGDTLTPEEREQGRKMAKKKKPKKSKTKRIKEQDELRKKELIDVLCRGNVIQLKQLLDNFLKIEENQLETFINEVLDDQGNTLLHIAAMNEQKETLEFLLKNEANPCLKNHKHQTAYTCTQSREIRETLKQFARENPDKYNYNKAQIPTNVPTLEEVNEKKKAQRKMKKEKEKVKRKENEVKRLEELEKERFLKLSDREKRALAAERRILNQSGTVTSRCFLCAADISGKVPFEYSGNRFCSVDCLKSHRMQNPVIL